MNRVLQFPTKKISPPPMLRRTEAVELLHAAQVLDASRAAFSIDAMAAVIVSYLRAMNALAGAGTPDAKVLLESAEWYAIPPEGPKSVSS